MIKYGIVVICLVLGIGQLHAQKVRPLTTYTIGTKVSPQCVSIVSLSLFEEGSGNDALNQLLIKEFMGNFMQSKPLQHLKFFYQQRQFNADSALDFTIYTAVTYSNNDLYSFTKCYKYACDKEEVSPYETEMLTLDASTGKALLLTDFIDSTKMDSLTNYIYKIVTMYRLRSLPTCKVVGYNPNQIQSTNGGSTGTDIITYERGLNGKFYISGDKFHLYNKVKHRDYDYDDVEVALPMNRILYFLKPEMAKRLGS